MAEEGRRSQTAGPKPERLTERFRVSCLIPKCGWKSDVVSKNPKSASREGAKHIATVHAELLEIKRVKVRVTTEIIE